MPALRDLQEEMLRRIVRQEAAGDLPIAEGGKFTPEQRLQIYKNNTHFTLRDLLNRLAGRAVSRGVERVHNRANGAVRFDLTR